MRDSESRGDRRPGGGNSWRLNIAKGFGAWWWQLFAGWDVERRSESMNRRRVLIAGLTALFVGGAAHAQSVRPQPASFRVEWERRTGMLRPAIEGYVYNDSEYRIGNVLLRIEILDVSGRRVSGKTAWVYGVIDAYGRGYFLLPVPEAGQTYQIAVESFDVLSRQMP